MPTVTNNCGLCFRSHIAVANQACARAAAREHRQAVHGSGLRWCAISRIVLLSMLLRLTSLQGNCLSDWRCFLCTGGKVDEAARETQAAGKDIKKDGQH